jgi:hypothetical protein
VLEDLLGLDGMKKPLEAESKVVKQAKRRTVILFSVTVVEADFMRM